MSKRSYVLPNVTVIELLAEDIVRTSPIELPPVLVSDEEEE